MRAVYSLKDSLIAYYFAAYYRHGVAAGPEMPIGARVLPGGMAALMIPQVLSITHVTFPC
ncbi:hypothetical protein [Actinoallomurus acaciae]|uniref:Uncharacterized protein n=1 Tax=Actinoallomurus acaciae TaxID=502577 RepID=A0ABV5YPV9_9ACTN